MPTIADQVADHKFGRLRLLIIGAGVAGLTLAALLHRRGEYPFVIERAPCLNDSGYNLAMYPLGTRTLHSLNAHEAYCRASARIGTYNLYTGDGRRRKRFEIGDFISRYGCYRGITRSALIDMLHERLDDSPVCFATTATHLSQDKTSASVTFHDGSTADFDLVVAADGLHSDTRGLLLNRHEYTYWDTGWSCWTTWVANGGIAVDDIVEYWGRGCFAGAYPAKNATGIVFGGPHETIERMGRTAFIEHALKPLCPDSPITTIVDAFRTADPLYLWQLRDCRATRWHVGRAVLLGDAATGILPTAGVGASVAMDSAAALDDEISRTDAAHVDYALRLYQKRQKHRVEAAQTNSRRLARLMLVNSRFANGLRDALIPFYSLSRALKNIAALMEA